jgi:hypothetical protein
MATLLSSYLNKNFRQIYPIDVKGPACIKGEKS